jgi:hypothetical protein
MRKQRLAKGRALQQIGDLLLATSGTRLDRKFFRSSTDREWWVMRIGREGSKRPLKAEAPFFFLILEPY